MQRRGTGPRSKDAVICLVAAPALNALLQEQRFQLLLVAGGLDGLHDGDVRGGADGVGVPDERDFVGGFADAGFFDGGFEEVEGDGGGVEEADVVGDLVGDGEDGGFVGGEGGIDFG